jgi:25S rRNA (uracil2634-N3)-methyltransferase
MPNLKSALLNAQHASAQKAAKAKHEQAKLLKQKSITGANKSQHAAGKRKAAMNTDALGRIVKEKKLPTSTGQVSRAPPVLPYDKDDTILLIGEGNFSYTLSLLSPPHSHPAHLVLATAYDTEAVCYEKYPDAAEHVKQIKERGAGVEFGVDAAQLGRCKAIGKQPRWSRTQVSNPITAPRGSLS